MRNSNQQQGYNLCWLGVISQLSTCSLIITSIGLTITKIMFKSWNTMNHHSKEEKQGLNTRVYKLLTSHKVKGNKLTNKAWILFCWFPH